MGLDRRGWGSPRRWSWRWRWEARSGSRLAWTAGRRCCTASSTTSPSSSSRSG